MVYEFENIVPKLGKDCFIAPSANVIGDVSIGDDSSIWFNSVVRGDVSTISIGSGTNIQDLCMLHVTEEIPLNIGSGVSVGHSVTLHSCTVEDNCLIGMGAVVLDHAVIGRNSLVAAGTIVPPGKKFPENSFIIGSPAVLKRPLNEKEIEGYGQHYKSYIETKNRYLNSLNSL